jgi:hypothetical protein
VVGEFHGVAVGTDDLAQHPGAVPVVGPHLAGGVLGCRALGGLSPPAQLGTNSTGITGPGSDKISGVQGGSPPPLRVGWV